MTLSNKNTVTQSLGQLDDKVVDELKKDFEPIIGKVKHTIILNPSGEGKTKIVSDAPVYKDGVKIWLDEGQEPMTSDLKRTLKKGQYKLAKCPVCLKKFNEHEGIDVEKGEVCCCEECASQFEIL